MVLFLFIEDQNGKTTFQILARRITNRTIKVIALKGSGEVLKAETVIAQIKVGNPGREDRVVAVVDKDCKRERFDKARELERKIKAQFPAISFRCVVAVEELESWLAGDLTAIQHVFGDTSISERLPNGECIDAKIYLKRNYQRNHDRDYISYIFNNRLAEQINIEKVSASNGSFKEFREALIN